MMGRIRTSSRYVIDIESALFGRVEGDFQCFGEFGASGRAMRMKIGRRVGDLHKLT